MPQPLKTAVIGVGYLGRFHAQKYAQLEDSELIGVVDNDPEQAKRVGEELGVPWHTEHEKVLKEAEAVSIVVPTVHHHKLAKPFLERGVHVLLEKPFAADLEEARDLLKISESSKVCLQIGHLERFNSVFTEHHDLVNAPQFIETIRIAPFPKRATDVDVILDLMIHDIDLVQALVGEIPEVVDAVGVPLITPRVDLAHARLRFPSGCLANLTASRVSAKAERTLRLVQPGLYLSLDFGNGSGRKLLMDPNETMDESKLEPEIIQLERQDALLEEIRSFLKSVRDGSKPFVTAQDGLAAMETAWKIKEKLAESGAVTTVPKSGFAAGSAAAPSEPSA